MRHCYMPHATDATLLYVSCRTEIFSAGCNFMWVEEKSCYACLSHDEKLIHKTNPFASNYTGFVKERISLSKGNPLRTRTLWCEWLTSCDHEAEVCIAWFDMFYLQPMCSQTIIQHTVCAPKYARVGLPTVLDCWLLVTAVISKYVFKSASVTLATWYYWDGKCFCSAGNWTEWAWLACNCNWRNGH